MTPHLPAFGICGYSGSGKTTVILELVRLLAAKGLRIGVIKHDVHGLDVDREGKDSDRFFRAGADVLMRSQDELFLRAHRSGDAGLQETLGLLAPYYDLLLLEGHKTTPLADKVWLQKDNGETCPPETINIRRVLRRDEDRAGILLDLLIPWLHEKCLATPLCAGILIGGSSRRMGRPKQLIAAPDGRTWLERIAARLPPGVKQVVLLGSASVPSPLAHLPLLPDVADREGPLAGMLAAMRWQPGASWLFLSCDMPLLTAESLQWVLSHRAPGVRGVLPRRAENEGVEPLPGWYDFRVRQLLEQCRGPSALAGYEKIVTPQIPAEFATAWANVNTQADLEALATKTARKDCT
ncbi:MAG: molybdopterin-guanine dinucleotide biosynthesis protein B [bacterium]